MHKKPPPTPMLPYEINPARTLDGLRLPIAMDARTRGLLDEIRQKHGAAWLEGLLETLLNRHLELRATETECRLLAGEDPTAQALLLAQVRAAGLEQVAWDYEALRNYVRELLHAGAEYNAGAAQLARALHANLNPTEEQTDA